MRILERRPAPRVRSHVVSTGLNEAVGVTAGHSTAVFSTDPNEIIVRSSGPGVPEDQQGLWRRALRRNVSLPDLIFHRIRGTGSNAEQNLHLIGPLGGLNNIHHIVSYNARTPAYPNPLVNIVAGGIHPTKRVVVDFKLPRPIKGRIIHYAIATAMEHNAGIDVMVVSED